mgnify:CR=1 FL=1|tara:strand:+ start:184 stop:816 length:633 start_codon:yes stop_codon:yes gene_type:complete
MLEKPGRLDRRKIKIAARGAQERRRHRRVPLAMPGRFLDQSGEQRCKLIDVSPGGAKILAKRPPAPGSRVVLMIEGLGRIEGDVLRDGANWFSLRFQANPPKRDRLADAITWRFNMERLGLDEDRVALRRPGKGRAIVKLRDGVTIHADVVDVSMSGAAFACLERPRVGERVQVGEMHGTVARILETGFAVAFDPPDARPVSSTSGEAVA